MASMNKPSFQHIQTYSPGKPVLIFVSSRRQTRLTALDLIAFLAGEEDPKMWLHMAESEMDRLATTVKDQNLRLTLAFGIGMHHAGLVERDRKTVEELFVSQRIQVLIATSTVAWGVNFPAHLVIIKGTEFYDGKQKRYVDMPITDVLQMMGRAGRPQFDDQGVACVLVHDVKKHFYKKFLYEPFPVESSLLNVLPDHLNAEIVAGTISTIQEALDYMTWTYFFRRLLQNPSYYGLEGVDQTNVNKYLSSIVQNTLRTLADSYCVEIGDEGDNSVEPTTLGRIASYYYLSHETVRDFEDSLAMDTSISGLLEVLVNATEYEQLPVRHNEDLINADLAKLCPIDVADKMAIESPHTKAHLLFQAHFSRIQLPMSDYYTDLKSVLDQAIRILQAMIDIAAESGWLATTLQLQNLLQMIVQGKWVNQPSLLCLPHVEVNTLHAFAKAPKLIESIPELVAFVKGKYETLASLLRSEMDESEIEDVFGVLQKLPLLSVELSLCEDATDDDNKEKQQGAPSIRIDTKDGKKWIKVKPDTDYTLNIKVRRSRYPERTQGDSIKAYAPHFPKPKDEGWFMVLGTVDNGELVALKRVATLRGTSNQQINFTTPEESQRMIMTLYIMSDSYIGLDQQYDLRLDF